MNNTPRTLTVIDHEIEDLEDQIRKLKEERLQRIKEDRRWEFTDEMIDLIIIIMKNPGINKEGIHERMTIPKEDYNNTMTTLRRRNCIVNEGSRREPLWYMAVGRSNVDCGTNATPSNIIVG
jgi:transcription initiation factor IIE alpha subunit